MGAQRREYFLQLVNTRTKRPINDDTGVYQVYTAGAATRPKIYDVADAEITQEVVGTSFLSKTMTDGQLHFKTNLTVSSVDISILTAGGRAYFLDGVTASQHRVDVDPEQQSYILAAVINDKASSTTVRPLGFRLKKGMVIKDVVVNVTGAFSGAALASAGYDIGLSSDSDGFVDLGILSGTGFKTFHPDLSLTGVVTTTKYGVKLAEFHASSTGNVDYYIRRLHIAATAVASNNLVVKRETALTASFTGTKAAIGKAYIYFMYDLLPGLNAGV